MKLTAIALLWLAIGVVSGPANASLPHFTAEDIFELEYVTSPTSSPNGRYVMYSRNSHNIMTDSTDSRLWLYDIKTQQHSPLFADHFNYQQATWSPQSDRIAFVSNQSGKAQLYVHYLSANRTALISHLPMPIRDLSWSPDGQWLAFTMQVDDNKASMVKMPSKPKGATWSDPVVVIDRARYHADGQGILPPAYRHLFVIPAVGGTERQLTSGRFDHQGPLAWTPDSQAILFSANLNDDWEYEVLEADLYAVELTGQKLVQITNAPGRESTPVFSASGKHLAYLSAHNRPAPYRHQTLNLMHWEDKSSSALLTDVDISVSDPQWLGDKYIYFTYDQDGLRKLARVTPKGKWQTLTDTLSGTTLGRPYLSGDFTVSPSGWVAYTHGTAQRPADLAIIKGNGPVEVVTALNDDVLAHRTLGEVHEIRYTSSFDNTPIQGWYITPPNFDPSKKYPLILEIHGGPHLAYGPHFSAEMQRYAAQGYVVFYDNHRGSSSYGEQFALLLNNKYSSEEDFADHNSGVDAMLAKGFIDEKNLFITGGSAGGIASAYAIGLTDRFAAAAVAKPVINWLSKVLTGDSYLYQMPNQFPGAPWENVEHYWKRSPLSLVGNVKTPTLLITGEQDRRTPMSETEQFYQALKLRRVDTVMVRVPGASHGIASRPSRMIAKIEHILAWFEKYKTVPSGE